MFNLTAKSFKALVCFFAFSFFPSPFIGNKLLAQGFNFANLEEGTPGIYIAGTPNPYSTNAPAYDALVIDAKYFSNLTNVPPLNGKNISILNYASVTITNCYFGPSFGAGIEIDGCFNVLIKNNFFANNRAGVYASSCTTIKVKSNQFINIHSIGPSGQYQSGQFVQFNACGGDGNEVSGNVGECFWGESRPEDLISMHRSSGTLLSPLLVKDNIFRGGGPSLSGGGIVAGDYGGDYITIQNNKLFNPGQYGIGITGGTGHKILNNDVWSDQKPWSNVGLPVWRIPGSENYPPCEEVEVRDNRVNFICGNSASCGEQGVGQPNNYYYPTNPEENCTGLREPPDPLTLQQIQPYFPATLFSINTANPEDKVWHIRDDAWNFYTQINQSGIYRPTAGTEADKTIVGNATTLSATNSSCSNCTGSNYYHWVQVSGPGTATITNSTAFTCDVSGLLAGVYEFRLEVTDDDGAADADWITVTVTPSSNPATLNGSVTLQGRPNPPNTQWQVPLQIDFYLPDNTTLVTSYNVTSNNYGSFMITSLPPGTYTISIKNSHTLKRVKQNQTLVEGNNVINFGTLLEGDVDNNNIISLADLGALMSSYNKTAANPGFIANADLNGDGVVNGSDLGLLLSNFNIAGESL